MSNTGKINSNIDCVITLLWEYTEDKPHHQNGLCYWLCSNLALDFPMIDSDLYSYGLIGFVRNKFLQHYGKDPHITRESGYNEVRAKFAEEMIAVLENNDFNIIDNDWCIVPKMSKEEKIAHHLVHYINARPYHRFGLCYWLCCDARVDYDVVETYRLRNSRPSRGNRVPPMYVDEFFGPTDKRVAFAKELLGALESGRLYIGKKGDWVYR